jgi:hypothetical protein
MKNINTLAKIKQKDSDEFTLNKAYRHAFSTPDGAKVIEDLERFCNGARTTIQRDSHNRVDEYATAVEQGKQAVYFEIKRRMENG